MYKINQNGVKELKFLRKCSYQEKLYKFLNYFVNEKNILTWMKDAWSLNFDSGYVENQLVNPLIRYFHFFFFFIILHKMIK